MKLLGEWIGSIVALMPGELRMNIVDYGSSRQGGEVNSYSELVLIVGKLKVGRLEAGSMHVVWYKYE